MSGYDAVPAALTDFLAQAPDALLLAPTSSPGPLKLDRAAVRVADRAALRALVLPPRVRAFHVAVHVAHDTAVLGLVPRPEWPALLGVRGRRVEDGWLSVLRFAQRVDVAVVVRELGRQAVWADRAGRRGLVVDRDGPTPDTVPPDVVLAPGAAPEEHPATGRTPLVLTDPSGPLRLGPLDERVLGPAGFADATGPVVALPAGPVASLRGLVDAVRPAAGVRLDLPATEDLDLARSVAALALAGVPLTASALPPAYRLLLGDAVADAVLAPVDLDDGLAREEHSVVLRRAAFETFSGVAWRRELGARAGVRVATQPAVSVVLATRRPEQLDFAVRQVARQRGVESLELVLAPHGYDADPVRVRELAGPGVTVQVVPRPAEVLFGDVLAAAAAAAGGDVVLKMDDDDWYGPDVVTDLLRARATSGAELVGMPAELHYLAPRDTTVKRGHPTELHAGFVAGGTMMVDRGLLHAVGSFRSVRKWVDAQLLAAVRAAGAATYRTHGLGYVLRRNASGHTWEADVDDLLDPARVQRSWEGFVPSRLLEVEARDRP